MWSQPLPWGDSCTDIFCLTQSLKWLTLFFPSSPRVFILCFNSLKHEKFHFMFPMYCTYTVMAIQLPALKQSIISNG